MLEIGSEILLWGYLTRRDVPYLTALVPSLVLEGTQALEGEPISKHRSVRDVLIGFPLVDTALPVVNGALH